MKLNPIVDFYESSKINTEKTGKSARETRKRKKVSLRQAAKQISVTPSYLSDLERGNRSWNGKKAQEYLVWLG